jgi:Mg2+-importing ATPase
MKYVRITISASFGNVLSMALASFFLPFLPMLPTQILLLNLLSDLPALAISSDLVDEEDLGSSRHWTMRGIAHFMVLFGIISTIFDLTLFIFAISILDSSPTQLRSAWFATSLLTEIIAIMVLRTRRPSWRSAPSRTLVLIAVVVSVAALAVPTLGILAGVELPQIDAQHLALVLAVAIGYWGATEFAKARTGMLR